MSELLKKAVGYAEDYQKQIHQNPVFPSVESRENLKELGGPLSEEGTDPEEVLRLLNHWGAPGTVKSTGGRYFGFVIGGALPSTVAANWLATAWDQCATSSTTSPFSAAIEQVALDWLLDIFRLPNHFAGAFTTGALMGHFSSLLAARHHLLHQMGWDVEAKGLFGAPQINVMASAEIHPTVLKVLEFLGFGKEGVVKIPVDDQGRVRAEQVPETPGPTILCLQAGNVNTGASDPIEEICSQFKAPNHWVHVDGAFGLWAAASEKYAPQVKGLELADSLVVDGHKWLNVPYDSGLAFVSNAKALEDSMAIRAPYLPMKKTREPVDFTPEFSRRARGVEIWAALKNLGKAGVADLIERSCVHAQRFAAGLKEAGFEILNEVALNQVLVSFGSAEVTQAVIGKIQEEGTCWAGMTHWQGRTAMRISVSSWATTDSDVEQSLDAIIRVAKGHLEG